MPFGEKTDVGGEQIDFDDVYEFLIKPPLEQMQLEVFRCDKIPSAGSLHREMLRHILDDDLAIVDITTLNPNVFYELGVRHALHRSGTILLRRKGTKSPFNIQGMRAFEYDLDMRSVAKAHKTLLRALEHALRSVESDSLVYDALPGLQVTPRPKNAAFMRTLKSFVITPSGKNPPMELVPDDKHGLSRLPSGCEGRAAKVTSVSFQNVYKFIICQAIDKVNIAIAPQGLRIQVTRGEDLAQGGNIVSQFLQEICRAEITITDVTGLNPNVLLEYGIRLSVRDSLNLLLCHRGVLLPIDIADQRFIEYTQEPAGVDDARE